MWCNWKEMKKIILFIKDKQSRAVGTVFMTMAIMFGAWVARLPEIKDQLGLSEGQLGLALFFMPLGATILLPFFGRISAALKERRSTMLGISAFLLTVVLPSLATNYLMLTIALLFVGFAMGLANVAMNASAAAVERTEKKSIMSACHGFFSLGGMIGAGTSSLFIQLGVSPFWHLVFWAVLMGSACFSSSKYLLETEVEEKKREKFSLPPRSVLGFALVGFCIMTSEGAITDWSTIYLKETLSAPGTVASFGFAIFAGFMALGRFFGDQLIAVFGSNRMLVAGCLLGLFGLLVLQHGYYGFALIGFGLIGLGYSIIIPTLFSQSAKQEGVKASVGIASVASSGYIGLLLGPVIIGFVAEHWGLGNGFMFLTGLTAIALVVVFLNSSRVKFK